MDIMFRSKKSTRVSASSTSTIAASPNGLSSVPYNQIPPTKPAPVAGPSNPTPFANGRRDQPRKEHVSAPLSNPGLNGDGADGRGMPPPSALRSVRESPRNHPDVGGEPEGSFRRATSDASPSNGIRYAAPTIILRRSCTPIQEFGSQTRHPYAAVRDSDAASILTVSSANSGHRPNPDLDRYPSFDPRASVSSRSNGRASVGPSTYAPSLHSLSSTMMTRLSGEFEASRPSDAEVETMFQQLLENRDLNASHSQVPSISSRNSTSSISQSNIAKTTASLPMETKRQMVESDARARWEHQKEMRRKEEEHLRSGKAKRGTAGSHVKNSPEWFLKKVLDGSLTTQHLATLNVSLRTLPLDWMRDFMACQGQIVLTNYLNGLNNRKGRVDVEMELELLKCMRTSLSSRIGALDAMRKPQIVTSISSSLVSPGLLSRKAAAEILVFFCHWDENNPDRIGLGLVLNAFDQLEQRLNNEVTDLTNKVGRFDVWLRQLEQIIDGRGRMGSMVGVSKDLRGQDDGSIMDYCVTMICLIQGLTSGSDIRARCSIRAQLETAGLLGIFYKVRQWNDDATTRMIRQYEQEAEADRRDLLEEQDRIVLQSMRSPEDVFRALLQMTRGSKASAYLLNSLRHLLLIKEEGDQKVRYFQLIDRLITSIIMNDTPDLGQDFSRAFGTSVSHLIGKFVEQERMDNAFQEVQELRASLAQVTREKFELSEEINRDDLVASLKSQIAELEERLRKSRAATEALTDQMEGMKRDYEARISDLELIIQELFNMLRESHHLEEVQGLNDGPINRNQLIYDLREQWERKKTIRKLEGKHAKRKTISAVEQGSHDEAVEVLKAEKVALGEAQGALKSRQSRALSTSQFMDAPDEQVRAHIEDALSTQADHISPIRPFAPSSRSTRARDETPTRRMFAPDAPPIGAKSVHRLSKKNGLPPRFLEELRYAQLSRSVSEPAISHIDNRPSDFRQSDATQRTNGTGYTSGASVDLQTPKHVRDSTLRAELLTRTKSMRILGSEDSDDSQELSGLTTLDEREEQSPRSESLHSDRIPVAPSPPPPPPPPAPPPPPPPPPVIGMTASTSAPVPPPPPPGGGPARPHTQLPNGLAAGLFAGLQGGVKLRSTGKTSESPDSAPTANPKVASHASRAPLAPMSSLLHGANDSRKDVSLVASKKMKQLQWEKVSKAQLGKTVWSNPELPEDELISKMRAANLWSDMEDEFKAKEIIYDAVKKRKETDLLSVLARDHRKRIEILMAGTAAKAYKAPEKLSDAIANFGSDLCTETFLSELQGVLPDDDARGKLLTHSADSETELELLHPADRLMVRLIQLPHLADRVKGMLFQVRFAQNIELLKQSLDLLLAACESLANAKLFRLLLNIILMMGNYLNGTNYAGGAFGFKIASINRLVDTKSSNGQNLLHFLERVVSTHFPQVEGFLDELAKPSNANRVNFADMQTTSKAMLEEIRSIRRSLQSNFQDKNDGYTRKMFRFSAVAEEELQEVRDGIVQAEKQLRDVQTYFGEGEEMGRPLQSQDFFGIFRTFTSSWKFCQAANRARQEEVATRERRAQARAALTPQPTGGSETNLIDARLQRLKLEGTPRPKRERRQPAPPLSPVPITTDFSDFMLPTTDYGAGDVDYGTLAQKMMANIFAGNGLGEEEVANGEDREMRSPESPSPMKRDLASLRGESPISPSPLSRVEEDDPEEELVEEDDESEGGDRTARDQAP